MNSSGQGHLRHIQRRSEEDGLDDPSTRLLPKATNSTTGDQNLTANLRGLAVVFLTLITILALCTVASENPTSPIDHPSIEQRLLWVSSILYLTTVAAIIVYLILIHKVKEDVKTEPGNNSFLLYIVVFVFTPTSILYLMFKTSVNWYLIDCQSKLYFMEPIFEAILIASAAGFAFVMFNKLGSNNTKVVVCCKATIFLVFGSCIGLWIKTLIIKEGEEVEKLLDHYIHFITPSIKFNSSNKCGDNNATNEIVKTLNLIEPYLSPFLIEFALSTTCLLYLPFMRASLNTTKNAVSQNEEPRENTGRPPVRWGPVLLGLILSALSLLTIFFITAYDKGEATLITHGLIIYNGIFIFVMPFCIILNIMFYLQVRKCEPVQKESHADRFLLWLSLVGQFFLSIGTLHAASSLLSIEKDPLKQSLYRTSIAHTTLRIIQSYIQTVSLDLGVRRHLHRDLPFSRFQPALVLLIVNLTFWMHSIGAAKISDSGLYMVANKYYDTVFWTLIKSVSYPLSVLYRMHTSGLFYEMFRECQ